MRRLAALIAFLPGIALAQPLPAPPPVPQTPAETAAAMHDHAKTVADAGWDPVDPVKLGAAVDELKRAIALDDVPRYECNLATVLERLGELARAHARLSRCTPRLVALDPTVARAKLDQLAALEAQLAKTHAAFRIDVSEGPATATITAFPDDEPMVLPTTVWVKPGAYTVTVRFPGRRDPATLPIAATAAQIGAKGELHVPTPPEQPLAAHVDERPILVAPVVPAPRRSRRTAKVVMIAGGAALAGGVVVHVLSIGPRDKLAGLSGAAYDDYASTWHRYQYGAIGLYGAGTVALGVGAYLFFRDRGSPVAVTPAPGGDGAMVSWTLAR